MPLAYKNSQSIIHYRIPHSAFEFLDEPSYFSHDSSHTLYPVNNYYRHVRAYNLTAQDNNPTFNRQKIVNEYYKGNEDALMCGRACVCVCCRSCFPLINNVTYVRCSLARQTQLECVVVVKI